MNRPSNRSVTQSFVGLRRRGGRRFPALQSAYYLFVHLWGYVSVVTRAGTRNGVLETELEEVYRKPDPWAYSSTEEEQERYSIALHAIDRWRDRRRPAALEVGCGEGLFTSLLAPRCSSVLGVDLVDTALDRARTTCAVLENVRLRRMDLLSEPSPGRFDLVVCMDVMEYLAWRPLARRRAMRSVTESVAPGGALLVTASLQHPVVERAKWARFMGHGAQSILTRFGATEYSLTLTVLRRSQAHVIALFQRERQAGCAY